jgi:hypothetical protein
MFRLRRRHVEVKASPCPPLLSGAPRPCRPCPTATRPSTGPTRRSSTLEHRYDRPRQVTTWVNPWGQPNQVIAWVSPVASNSLRPFSQGNNLSNCPWPAPPGNNLSNVRTALPGYNLSSSLKPALLGNNLSNSLRPAPPSNNFSNSQQPCQVRTWSETSPLRLQPEWIVLWDQPGVRGNYNFWTVKVWAPESFHFETNLSPTRIHSQKKSLVVWQCLKVK